MFSNSSSPDMETPAKHRERFVQALKQALVANKYSQRELCEALGITIGTLTKYLRGSVDPSKVGVAIMRKLAGELGFTTNALIDYFETGEYRSTLSIDDVASWIRSEAGQQDLPELLMALQEYTASAVGNPESAARLKKLEQPAWAGYTDEEAETWCTNMHDCVKHLAAKQGTSLRGVWPIIEQELISYKLSSAEMDELWEVTIAGAVVTGDQLTDVGKRYAGRFDEPCPLSMALKKFSELSNYKPLAVCIDMCNLAAA